MVYEQKDVMVVLSKDGKYKYIQHDLVYVFKKDYYDDADDMDENKHSMSI